MRRLCLFTLLYATIAMPASAMRIEPDQFPDAPRGTLSVHMSIGGANRWTSSNGVEFTNVLARRSVDMDLRLVLTNQGNAPMVAIRGHDVANPEMPEAQQTIVNAVEACKGDLACQIEAALRYGQALDADPDGFGSTEWDEDRYENWISDRSQPCVKGTFNVADSGNGSAINPPLPARPFTFTHDGELDLAGAPDIVVDRLCNAWLSFDSIAATVSIRLPAYGMWIDTAYSGGFSGEQHTQLIENAPELIFSLDQSAEWNDDSLGGVFTIDDIGKAYAGGLTTPLSATITWSFTPDFQ